MTRQERIADRVFNIGIVAQLCLVGVLLFVNYL